MQTIQSIALNLKQFGKAVTAAALLLLLQTASMFAATWYVAPAPTGSDSNAGSQGAPFATISKAQSSAASGDTVYLRGGTYFLNNSNLTFTNSPYVVVNNITKSGISYLAYPGERPIFDFSNVLPSGYRVTAFLVSANNCTFKGFEVVSVQVTIQLSHTQSECFRIAGNNNRFEQLSMHDGMGIGWYLTSGANNLVLNCDAYRNAGLDSGSIGNTDGFGCHPNSTSGTNNVFRGCRAWFNSDDNYDCINASAAVTFDHCWAFYAGYYTNFVSTGGDANGFKGGGYGAAGDSYPSPVPRHVIQFCVSVHNRASGFYANHHIGGQNWFNNTSYRNAGANYNMLSTLSDNLTDVPGYGHLMKNNLSYLGTISNLDTNLSDVTTNSWTLPVTVSSNDFVSLDESLLTAPRDANGELPVNTVMAFAHLAGGSDLINKGVNIVTNSGFGYTTSFPFNGAAPDLGRFDFGLIEIPNFGFELPLTSTNIYNPSDGFWTFSGSAGNGSGVSANNGTLTSANKPAPEVKQVGFLQGTGSIAQTLPGFTPGTAYKITFSAAQRNRVGELGQTWDVKVGNTVIASFAPPVSATNYVDYSATFIANSPTQTLAFVGTDLNGGDNTVLLDKVVVGQISALGLVWTGDGVANNWDSTSSNWFNGATTVPFLNGSDVAFDDTGSNAPPVNLVGTLSPASVIVNASQNYTFGGGGSLGGMTTVGKAGTGTLTINTTNSYSGSTIAGGGTLLVNGSLDQSPVTVVGSGVIGGTGQLGGGLIGQAGGSVMPGNGANVAGTLSISNGLTESGGVINLFDLSNDPTGITKTNDLINVIGDLNLSGINTIQINPLNGSLSLGTYSLISYSGSLSGGLTNLTLAGSPSSPSLYGSLTNLPGGIALLVSSSRSPASLLWNGGAAGSNWDTGVSTNWWNDGFLDYFFAGDSVTFANTTSTNVTLVGALTPVSVVVNAMVNYSFGGSGSLSGSGSLTKTNSGTLVILTTNTYSGATTVQGGTLLVNGSLDQSAVSVAGGAAIGGSGRLGGGLTAQTGSKVIVGSGTNVVGTLTVSNGLTEAGGVINLVDLSSNPSGTNDVINVLGNLTLSGTNTIQLTLLNGTLGAGVYPLITYTGTLSGGLTNLVIRGGFGILTNPPGQIALFSNGRPPGNLFWNGSSAAGTNWNNGISTNWLNGTTPDQFFTLDSVTFTNTTATNVVLVGSLQPASVLVNATVNYLFGGGGTLSGSTGLTKTNSGPLTILTTNNYTGVTVLNGGTLNVGQLTNGGLPSPIGAASSDPGNLVLDGGAFRYTGPNVGTDRGATLNAGGGTLEVSTTATTLTNSGVLAGVGGLTKVGSGALTLSGGNTFGGGLTVNAGTVTLNASAGAGTGTLTFNGGTVVMNAVGGPAVYANPVNVVGASTLSTPSGNNNQALGGAWFGNGTLTNNTIAGGTFSVQGDMNGFGGTLMQGGTGTFRFYSASTGSSNATFNLGTGTAIMQTRDGGPINLGALIGGTTTHLRGAGSSATPGTYFIGGNNLSTTYSGTISNGSSGSAPTAITKVGSGTLILAGIGVYAGQITISNGTLQVGNAGTTGSLGTNYSAGVVNNGTLAFNRSNTIIITNAISGTGNLSQLSSGILILVGTNSYGGLTTISAGTLQVGNGGTTGTLGTGNVTNSGTLVFNLSNTLTNSAGISGSGSLVKTNSGTVILTGASTYTGLTTISNGTLQVGNGGTTGTLGTNNVVNSGVLAFNRSNAISFDAVMSGNGSLLKLGSGSLSLTRSNTYSGGTTVSNGTLVVNNTIGSGTGTGAVAVVSGATLGGSGIIAGPVTIGSGATLAPGTSPGTLTVTNTLVVNNAAFLRYDLGASSDLMVVSNNLTLGGTLNINDAGGFTTNTYLLFNYSKGLTYNGVSIGTAPAGYTYAISTVTTSQIKLVVGYQPVVAGFSGSPTNGVEPLVVNFTDTSSGLITNRFWDFGDGNTTNFASATNPAHTYAAGAYSVTLIVSGPAGVSTNIQPNYITVVTVFQNWQMQYFGCTNCPQAAASADPDGDGQSNLEEFQAGTDPTNSLSGLRIISTDAQDTDVLVTWATAGGRTNALQATTGNVDGDYDTNFTDISGPMVILGTGDTTTNYLDVGAVTNAPTRYYRIRLVP